MNEVNEDKSIIADIVKVSVRRRLCDIHRRSHKCHLVVKVIKYLAMGLSLENRSLYFPVSL